MRYAIQQRVMTFGDDFWVRDSHGRKKYSVHGAVYSFANNLSLRDVSGNKRAVIKQKLFTFVPTYKIWIDGKFVATVSKRLISFRRGFKIKLAKGEKLKAEGSFIFHDYQILRGDKRIANISKRIGTFTDCYGVEVKDDENQLLIIAVAIAFDMMIADRRKGRKG